MFVVRAIQNKHLQREICHELNAHFFENALAYCAVDLQEDGASVDSYISICQFYMKGDAEIVDLTAADGREEDEAVIVMLRAVMSFMNRCGVKNACFGSNATDEFWLKKSGFVCTDGVYRIDLDKFYSAPCKHSKEN